MIILVTGVPGAGKSLYALNLVKDRAQKEQRVVYYDGIADLKLPWIAMDDPEKWYDVPKGSLIVIDEAQRVFRPRGTGAHVPKHVAELETHRHMGVDIVLVTQHPMLIDSNIRRLVGQHFHVVRRFGGQRAVVHEWSSCTEISKSSIMESVRHEFAYPKESFAWYKSAEVHTHKRRIPMRVWFMFAAPAIIAGLVWFGWTRIQHWSDKTEAAAKAVTPGQPAAVPAKVTPITGQPAVQHLTADDYRKQYVPRVKGLAHTAPVYDEVTKVTRAPLPVSCMASKAKCLCYSQDATYMSVPEELCREIVAKGYFINFPAAGSQTLANTPASGTATALPVSGSPGADGRLRPAAPR